MGESERSRTRKRAGCYTCRSRKVRCEATASVASSSPSPRDKCGNCQRLGFDCHWDPPPPGQTYLPPPKRRRTLTGGRRRDDLQNGDPSPPANPVPLNEVSNDEPTVLPSDPTLTGALRISPEGWSGEPLQPFDLSNFFDFGESIAQTPLIDDTSISNLLFSIPQEASSSSQNPWLDTTLLDAGHASAISMVAGMGLPSTGVESSIRDRASSDDDNRFLIQHYLEVMKGYAKVQDQPMDQSNPYIMAFSKALSTPALFNAILAYSAAHLSLTETKYHSTSEYFARLAFSDLDRSLDVTRSPSTSLHSRQTDDQNAALLWAIFILIKKAQMLAAPISEVITMLDMAKSLIVPRSESGLSRSVPSLRSTNGSVDDKEMARRIILRLGFVDSRAALFRMGGGSLTRELLGRGRPGNLGDQWSSALKEGDVELLRADALRLEVAEMDQRLLRQTEGSQTTAPFDITVGGLVRASDVKYLHARIAADLKRAEQSEGEAELHAGNMLDHETYNRLLQCCVLHSSLLYLWMIWPIPNLMDPKRSIEAIFRYQLLASRDPTRSNTPSSIWPSSLIFAGCLCDDPIYRDWCASELRRGERWGKNVTRAREVCETVWRERDRRRELDDAIGQDPEPDIGKIVRALGGFLL